MKVNDLAAAANLSAGLLWKVENGEISPSLTTLQAISRGLAVPITWLVSRVETERTAVFSKAATDTSAAGRVGQQHILLSDTEANAEGLRVESHMISLTCETDVFPAIGDEGTVFLYLLQGEIAYRHGATVYRLTPGDSLFFDAATRHHVDELAQFPVWCLSVTTRRQDR
jgi:transcriptional regulator with XRE-family HTH domain